MAEEIKGIGPAFVTKLRKDYITYGYQMPDYSGKDREKLEAVIKLRESVMCLGELMFGTESRRFITELTDTLRNFYYDTPLFAKEKDVLLIERSLLHWFNFYLEEGCPNLKEVMFKVNTELDSFDEDEDEDVISVETVHASKGREYPIVIAAGFNSIREMADPEDEEKNVLYVQFTRAMEKMYVIDSMTYVTQDNRTIYPKKNKPFAKMMKVIRG
jgi:superfamily I DNA/RNA helicase